jgi:hypothetical protein
MYNYIGYAVDWSPQCCHIDCCIIVTTSVSSLHQTALPTRPSLSPRVYNMHLSPSRHSSKVHCCHKTEGATEKNGTNDHQYSMDTYRGVSGQAVVTKYSTCHLNRHHLSTTVPREVRFHLGVNFFPIQFYVGTRGLLTYVYRNPTCRYQHSNPLKWPSSRRNKNGQGIILRANRAGNRLVKTCTKRRCIQNFPIPSPIGDIRYPSGAILE